MPDQPAASGDQPAPGGGPAHISQRPSATAVRKSRTDQLFERIKGIAGNALQEDAAADPQRQPATPEMQPGAGAARAGWLSGTQVAGDALRTFFSEASGPGIKPGMPGALKTSYAPSRLTRSIHGLLRENTPAGDAMVGADGTIRNLVAEQRASLNGATNNSSEQMTIDIVAMLFEFILRDSQIPAEVRAQLGRLQFLVLKAALLEPELLTRKSHPARMMINRIGSISIGLKQVDPSGIRITAEISRIVASLLEDETENPQIFSKMLDELDAFIARELRASDMQVERAAQAVEKAENRTLHFAHTTAQIGAALSGLAIAPFLHDFFITTWAHAIERASRTDSKREKRFKQLIADLLWSIVPKVTGQDRAQLVALLPIMLLELRDGLELAGLEPRQRQDILDWLIDAHTQAMRSGSNGVMSNVPSLSDIHQHLELLIAQTAEDLAPQADIGQHAGDGNFVREAVRELDIDLQVIDAAFNPAPGPGRPLHDKPTAEDDAVIMAHLRSGEMVEINLGTTWTRGRLSWISPRALHLLLSTGHNNTLSVLGLPVFRRLLANGRVRFPEAAPLFERAVQSLLQAADRVDGSSATK